MCRLQPSTPVSPCVPLKITIVASSSNFIGDNYDVFNVVIKTQKDFDDLKSKYKLFGGWIFYDEDGNPVDLITDPSFDFDKKMVIVFRSENVHQIVIMPKYMTLKMIVIK